MPPLKTLAEVYSYVATHYSHHYAINDYSEDKWRQISTQEFCEKVKYLTLGLVDLGIKRGDCIGIFSPSSPEWMIADFAILFAGGIVVPLFASISVDNLEFEVEQTNLSVIFVSGEDPWKIVSEHSKDFSVLISLEGDHQSATHSLNSIIELGKKKDLEDAYLFGELLDAIQPDDLATIIYTSGSTGVPKGAEITHYNLCHLIPLKDFGWDRDHDRYLSILPLAHIFARQINLILFAWGVPIYFLNDLKQTAKVCQQIHPTLMIVVPRVLERVHAKMVAKVEEAHGFKKTIAHWAFDLASQTKPSLYKKLLKPIADTLVYSKLRESLGGSFRVIISGGARLNPSLNQFFMDIGVPVFEGWGLTEASTAITNLPEKQKIGTIGQTLGDVKVTLSDESEILIGGPTVMRGYYKNPVATKKAIDEEGWLHTGDKGSIDDEGYVTIFGRLKEMYKASTGEFITPVPIEQKLSEAPLIDLALVIGEDRPFATCLVFPDFELVEKLKKSLNKQTMSNSEFLTSQYIKEQMENLIKSINEHVSEAEQIMNWRFIMEHPTIEGGELTPTMKLRRDVVMKKHHDLIESMYKEIQS